jgi:RNA polymerase sigma-70 factor (ECF subfamily)
MEDRPLSLVKQPDEAERVPDTLDELYRAFAPYVARLGGRILNHTPDVDDLVQDVFIDAWSGLEKLRSASAVKGWLATVTVRKARRRIRRRAFLARLGFGGDFDPSTQLDASASAETHAWASTVYRILDGLSADARIAWVLHRVEGESLERVGELTGCSRATAHRRVRDAELAFELELQDASTN